MTKKVRTHFSFLFFLFITGLGHWHKSPVHARRRPAHCLLSFAPLVSCITRVGPDAEKGSRRSA